MAEHCPVCTIDKSHGEGKDAESAATQVVLRWGLSYEDARRAVREHPLYEDTFGKESGGGG